MPSFYDQLKECQLENLGSDPSNTPRGRFWFRTDLTNIKYYDGAALRTLVENDKLATLTNKIHSDSTCTFGYVSDLTKLFKFQLSGITAGQTRTWTVPDADGTFVGLSNTQVLSNKEFSDAQTWDHVSTPSAPAASKYKLYAKTTGIYYLDSTSTEFQLLTTAPSNTIPTGVMNDYVGVTAPSGWVLASGRTIGDGTSGGTERANADTSTLFALLWDSFSNTELVIQDSAGTPTTRGANAAADYAAHKRMPLPDLRGRVAVGKDDMGGTDANRITTAVSGFEGSTQGAAGGAESHTLVSGEMPSHTHTQNSHTHSNAAGTDAFLMAVSGTGTNTVPGGTAVGLSTATAATTATNQNTGGGGAHRNIQPSYVMGKIIKL